jgi:hypothetical protein
MGWRGGGGAASPGGAEKVCALAAAGISAAAAASKAARQRSFKPECKPDRLNPRTRAIIIAPVPLREAADQAPQW